MIAFDAFHEGVSQADGFAMDERQFNGLGASFELSEEALLFLTQSLKPEVGLMNGTRAIAKRVIYAPGCHPNHDNAMQRLPACIIVDVPTYTGPALFQDADKRTWAPISRAL